MSSVKKKKRTRLSNTGDEIFYAGDTVQAMRKSLRETLCKTRVYERFLVFAVSVGRISKAEVSKNL